MEYYFLVTKEGDLVTSQANPQEPFAHPPHDLGPEHKYTCMR